MGRGSTPLMKIVSVPCYAEFEFVQVYTTLSSDIRTVKLKRRRCLLLDLSRILLREIAIVDCLGGES